MTSEEGARRAKRKARGTRGRTRAVLLAGRSCWGTRNNLMRRDVGRCVVSAPLGGRASVGAVAPGSLERGTRDSRAGLALVDMWPKTGRTHQLRRHAAETLLAPILGGDGRYAKREHRAGALVSTTSSTTTKTRGGGRRRGGAGEEGGEEGEGEEGEGEGGEGLFLFAAELSLPLSAMPWLGGGDARAGRGGSCWENARGGLLASGGGDASARGTSSPRRRRGRRGRPGGDVAQGARERAGEVRRQARAREASARTRRGGG